MRRRLITHPRFQASFTLAYVQGIFLALAVPAVVLFFALYYVSRDPALNALQRAAVIQALNSSIAIFLIFLLLAVLAFALIGIYRSYRFIGPLKRVESWAIRHLQTGEISDLKLREGDDILAVVDILNRIIGKIL